MKALDKPTLALVGVTAIWGSTFVVVKDAVEKMPVTDFLTWRFALAAAAMLLLRPRSVAALGGAGRRAGFLVGLALGAGYLLQTLGLQHTSAAVSGFITGMFVVLTPLGAAVLLRRPPGRAAWLAVGLATVGLGLLSLHGFAVGAGELLTLGCAAAFALHIVGLGQWAKSYDAFGLAVVQLLTTALLCGLVAVPGGLAVPPDASVWGALALTALAATALAFVVQTWAQAHLAPTRAAVVMTMEPVFGGVFAVLLAGEVLGLRTLLGAALVLAAMVLTEVGPRHGAEGSVERLEV
ncbi:MAG: Threonine/homoserine efflux transporter RhtA [Frankiales bacterium]|jgi:drug/metabolite transporter (DMT)-like permease|nr:Threonine/homoserine efflux transporter RhtA [Frankiales bacterium]